ncbi:MAG: ABC transporter ATP-binding protein, partial [Actinomycetota bacterium]
MDAIRVEGIRKTYRVGVGRARVREMTPPPFDRALARLFPRWWTRNTFNALDDVTLSVPAGSSVGIVGHNGAGKTTLLKVVAGVTYPNAGKLAVSGRIAALIDALVGFHPDLTGRENTYLLGAMHGFGRRAMASRVERILQFAEIDEMADTQLKRYSAGMAARLGFAIITALDVEILMVDEVLAVGDAAFQRKCIRWLDEYRAGGGTLVFVSHNLSLVRNMTDRVVGLDPGPVMDDGGASDVLGRDAHAMEHRGTGAPVPT